MRIARTFMCLFLISAQCFSYSVRPVKLDNLFKEADFVGLLKIIAGESENHRVAVYKAEVLQVFKGEIKSRFIYFGPYLGSRIGGEYLVFLKKNRQKLLDLRNEGWASDTPVFNPEEEYYSVMYEGYGRMESGYECVFETNKGTSCDNSIKLFPEQILLPQKLKSYPPEEVDTLNPMNPRWVHKTLMVQYLSDMCRRSFPTQCRLEEPTNDFMVPANITVRGMVIYPDGTPAEEADVDAVLQCGRFGLTHSAKTGADGKFEIKLNKIVLECNSFEYYAGKRSAFWLKTSDTTFLPADKTTIPKVKFDPPKDPNPVVIQLGQKGAELEVQVKDSGTGKYLESYVDIRRIDLPNNSASIHTRTGIDGSSVTFFVPEGKYEIHASGTLNYSASWTGVKKAVNLKAGEHSSLTLEFAQPRQ